MGAADLDLIWMNIFMFKTDRNFRESVVWRKYAPDIQDVHSLGCTKEWADRRLGKDCTYFGALSGNVDRIRDVKSAKGARLEVVHVPSEGIHHAEIGYVRGHELTKND